MNSYKVVILENVVTDLKKIEKVFNEKEGFMSIRSLKLLVVS